jgi:hypothetical protein
MERSCEHGDEISGRIKCWKNLHSSCITDGFSKGLSSMELDSYGGINTQHEIGKLIHTHH